MTKKVKVAIFDRDLKVRTLQRYPLSKDGSKIKIRTGGKGHFKPAFDNESYLEFPRFLGGHEKVYLVRRGAKACVNFKDDPATVYGPDPEEVMTAAKAEILEGLGKEKQETPFILFLILGAIVLIALKVFGVLV